MKNSIKHKKKLSIILLLIFSAVFFSGCWNYKELNMMTIVAGIAIDRGVDNTGYRLTFEVIDTSGSGNETEVSSLLIQTDGLTIFDACRNALERSDKKLYFGACKTVVISEDLAREGITPILDWLRRDAEVRSTINIYISKEKTAAAILEYKSLTNPITSYSISKMANSNLKALSKSIYVQMYEANNMLNGEGIALSLPALKIETNLDEKVPVFEGTAVFSADKLIGYLDSEETKYFSFFKEDISGGLLLICVDSDVQNASLEILGGNMSIKTEIIDGSSTFKLNISLKVALGELQTQEDCDTEEKLKELEEIAEETVCANVSLLIKKVQTEYASDIFGLGNALYQHEPAYWEEINQQWNEIFASLDVSVDAEVNIVNTAEIFRKNKVEE